MILGSLPPLRCGVGDSMVFLSAEVAKQSGAKVVILTGEGASSIDAEGVDVRPVMRSWSLLKIIQLRKLVREFSPDIVHIQFPSQGYGTGLLPYFLPLILQSMGLPVVQTWHEPPVKLGPAVSFTGRLRKYLLGLRYIPNFITSDAVIEVEKGALSSLRFPFCNWIHRKNVSYVPVTSNIPSANLNDEQRNEIRRRYADKKDRIISTFGFAYPHKGLERMFEIADPSCDVLVLILTLEPESNSYHKKIYELVRSPKWDGRVVVTGHLPMDAVGQLLKASDVVLFPFLDGVYSRSGSFMAALAQGTFTITTRGYAPGYDSDANVFYCLPDDLDGMREALRFGRNRGTATIRQPRLTWSDIASQHCALYDRILGATK